MEEPDKSLMFTDTLAYNKAYDKWQKSRFEQRMTKLGSELFNTYFPHYDGSDSITITKEQLRRTLAHVWWNGKED